MWSGGMILVMSWYGTWPVPSFGLRPPVHREMHPVGAPGRRDMRFVDVSGQEIERRWSGFSEDCVQSAVNQALCQCVRIMYYLSSPVKLTDDSPPVEYPKSPIHRPYKTHRHDHSTTAFAPSFVHHPMSEHIPTAATAAVPPLPPAPRATAQAVPPATPSPAAAKCAQKRKAPAAKAAAESPSTPQPVGKRAALFDLAREDQEARLVVRPCPCVPTIIL